MSAIAAPTGAMTPPAGEASGDAAGLLTVYAEYVRGLEINPDAKRLRRRAAEQLAAWHPDLTAWMTRPTAARLADLRRTGAWPFVCWCFVEGYLRPDLDLLVAKTPAGLYAAWTSCHPDDLAAIVGIAQRFGWSANWTRDVSSGGLALLCVWAGKTLNELHDADFAGFADELAAAPSATASAGSQPSAAVQPAPGLL